MDKTLTVSLSRTFDGAPLAVVDNLPGGGAELRPAQLRALRISYGLMVQRVQGLAARAGVQPGDVIVGVNNSTLTSAEQFRDLIDVHLGTVFATCRAAAPKMGRGAFFFRKSHRKVSRSG